MGMETDFGADGHWWEFAGGGDGDGVINTCSEGGDVKGWVVLDVVGVGDKAQKVPVDEFFLGEPKLLVVLIDDGVLMWVAVLSKDTGGLREEVWEEGGSDVIVGCGSNGFSLSGGIGRGR